jgi:RNase P/RNase MRP subunit POP5
LKRTKQRYLALQFECEALPSEREFIDAVWASTTKLYGEVGASTTRLSLINFDIERKIAVIRISLSALSMVKASVGAIPNLKGKDAAVHVLAVSGTLKALYSNIK